MRRAVLVALTATVGNFLQGWDNSVIAGAVLYIKQEFNLQTQPTLEGLILAMAIIGGTLVTTLSGPVSDSLGRRPMLLISSVLYFISGLVMLWTPNVYVLLLARLLNGFGVGLAVTIVPLYISETAPSEVRGLLNTLPQLAGSGGMFLSYCMVFGMSLMESPNWRLMLGILSIPSLIYFALIVMFMPESPRWLVSKGRMLEAKHVVQRLRGREDVSEELALLVEGLGVGRDTHIEEFIIGPANDFADDHIATSDKDHIRLYGPEEGVSWVAKPVAGNSILGMVSRNGSMAIPSPRIDPIVTLFDSVHETSSGIGSRRSILFPGSMLSESGHLNKADQSDLESQKNCDEYASDADNNLQSPLLSREGTTMDKDIPHLTNSTCIGGGWQLVWKWSERIGDDGKKEGGLQRMFLHQEGTPRSRIGSMVSVPGADTVDESELVQAAALVSQPVLYSNYLTGTHSVGPAMAHPSGIATNGPKWKDLLEPGVKRALFVGMSLQLLQQFSGINALLYYGPQILEEAGVAVLLSNMGISSDSASFLISCLTTLCMLPCIIVSMRLMDISGRRTLLLATIPILILSLLALVLSSIVKMGSVVQATISTAGVVVYVSCFVMAFGVIPNILCAELFPTRVRGLCITLCALTYWISNIIITYSTPILLKAIGLTSVFSIFCATCVASWIFVLMKVPETKGMPLEVISELFSLGAKQSTEAAAKLK